MRCIAVEIVRFVDNHFPGFVECVLLDAEGGRHVVIEKVPVITSEWLDATSHYPRPGIIACEVEAEWIDQNGQALVRVNTELPWGIASINGETRFTVPSSKVSEL